MKVSGRVFNFQRFYLLYDLHSASTYKFLCFTYFSESALMYSKAVAKLDQIVMNMVSKYYGIEEHYELLRKSTTYLLKLIKYLSPQEDGKNLGILPHTDKSFMTILHQDEVNGLEIMMKDGEWTKVDLKPSSFVVMAGDAYMVINTNKV